MSEQEPPGGADRRRAHPATHLVREVAALGRDLDRAMGAHLTVNATDLRAMEVLLGRGPLVVSELAAALGLGVPATSMAVDRLERLGHVTRERDDRDRRRVAIRATPSSTARAREKVLPMIRAVDAHADALDEGERAVVQRYLQQVVETMRAHTAGSAPETGDAVDA